MFRKVTAEHPSILHLTNNHNILKEKIMTTKNFDLNLFLNPNGSTKLYTDSRMKQGIGTGGSVTKNFINGIYYHHAIVTFFGRVIVNESFENVSEWQVETDCWNYIAEKVKEANENIDKLFTYNAREIDHNKIHKRAWCIKPLRELEMEYDPNIVETHVPKCYRILTYDVNGVNYFEVTHNSRLLGVVVLSDSELLEQGLLEADINDLLHRNGSKVGDYQFALEDLVEAFN